MTDKITRLQPDLLRMRAPSALADLKGWLVWKFEEHPNGGKPLKVPYYTTGAKRVGRQGGATDRSRLVTFDAARDAALKKGFDGVGLALMPEFGIVALDFDACLTGKGEAPKDVLEIVSHTYTEISPSGTGLRAFVRGDLGNRKSKAVPENDVYGFETFSSSGYVTFTGEPFWTNDMFGNADHIAEVGEPLLALCEKRFGSRQPREVLSDDDASIEAAFNAHTPRLELSLSEIEELLDQLDPDMGRDDWIRVGMAVHHETEGGDDGFFIWDEWSSNSGKYPSTEALQEQWDSFTRRADSGKPPVTMATVKRMVRLEGGEAPHSANTALTVSEIAEAAGMDASEAQSGKYRLHAVEELLGQPPVEWLIKGVIPKADIGMIYGASGAGKSFVALDMVCAMARGVDWRGKKTRKAKVLLVAAEGAGGMANRLQAYCSHHGIDPRELCDLKIMTSAPNLMKKDDALEVVKAIKDWGGCDCIVFDTFAQVTPGANENAGEDMGVALAHAKGIGSVFRAMVVLIHHAGKDTSKGARGWSGLRAASDFEIEVIRFEDSHRRLIRVRKQKDGRDGEEFGLALEEVLVGMDADGDEITSCVAVDAEIPAPQPEEQASRRKPLSQWEQIVLDTVSQLDPGEDVMPLAKFALRVVGMTPDPEPGKRDTRQFFAVRAITSLAKKGVDVAGYALNGTLVIFS